MVIVSKIRSRRSDIDTKQIDIEVVSVLRLVDDWDRNGAVLIDPSRNGDFFNTAQSINADGAGTSEAEVGGKGPETGRDEVVVVVETNQGVVPGRVLSTPPVHVTGGVAECKRFVHVHGPLETLAGRLSVLVSVRSKEKQTYASWPVTSQ